MKKSWIAGLVAAVVVLVVAAGGYYLFFQNKVQSQVEQQLRAFFANPPPPYTKASYGKLDVALASRRITIDNIVLERSAPPYVIKIDKFDATGVDTDNLQFIIDPAAYKDGAPDQSLRKLAETLTLTKIDSDSRDDGHTTIDQFAAKGIQGRQFAVKPDPTTINAMSERDRALMLANVVHVDSLTIDKIVGTNAKSAGNVQRIEGADLSRRQIGSLSVQDIDIKDQKDGTRTTWKRLELRDVPTDAWFDYAMSGKRPTDMLQFVSLGGMKITDLKVEPGKPGETAMRVASVDLGKVSRQKLEKLNISGIEIIDAKGGVNIGVVEIAGLDWEQILPLIGKDNAMSGLADLRYGVDKFSIRDISGTSLDAIGATLKEISVSGSVNSESGKDVSIANISQFEIDVSKVKDQEMAGALTALGYKKLNLSMETAGTGDRKAGTTSLDKLRIFGPEVGELNLSFALSDYFSVKKAPGQTPSFGDAIAPLMAAKMQGLTLSWKDDGLTERLLKVAGMQNGMSADQMRETIVAQVKGMGQVYGSDPAVAAAFKAVVDYLNKPKSLVINAKPPAPPRLGELDTLFDTKGGPPDLPAAFRVLGVTVSAN